MEDKDTVRLDIATAFLAVPVENDINMALLFLQVSRL